MYGTSNAGLTSLTDDRETPILAVSVFICRVCITNRIAVRPLYQANHCGNAAGFEIHARFTRWKFPMTVSLALQELRGEGPTTPCRRESNNEGFP